MKRAGIVLCGGGSSRMGRPKAWLPWFGQTMLEHVVERLSGVVDETIVVTSPELDVPASLIDRAGLRVVRDRKPGCGPLAGIREGLEAAVCDDAFVTSADAPFVTASHVDALFSLAREKGKAVAPIADGHVQVLSAVYPGKACEVAEALLAKGMARPLALLEHLGFASIDCDSRDAPPAWQGFNTPAQYLDCVRMLAPDAMAEVEVLGRLAVAAPKTVHRLPVGTLGEVLAALPFFEEAKLVVAGRLAKAHLVSLGGRELVRDLGVPIGPGERVSLIDALAGG